MRCRHCPLFDYDAIGEECCWLLTTESELRYENNKGEKVGCYVQKYFIVQKAKQLKEQAQQLKERNNESIGCL